MSKPGRLIIDALGVIVSIGCSAAVGFLWLFIIAGIVPPRKGTLAWMGGFGEYVLAPIVAFGPALLVLAGGLYMTWAIDSALKPPSVESKH